jgi:hypothetical protein
VWGRNFVALKIEGLKVSCEFRKRGSTALKGWEEEDVEVIRIVRLRRSVLRCRRRENESEDGDEKGDARPVDERQHTGLDRRRTVGLRKRERERETRMSTRKGEEKWGL